MKNITAAENRTRVSCSSSEHPKPLDHRSLGIEYRNCNFVMSAIF